MPASIEAAVAATATPEAIAILAAHRGAPLSPQQVSVRTGLLPDELAEHLALLVANGLLLPDRGLNALNATLIDEILEALRPPARLSERTGH